MLLALLPFDSGASLLLPSGSARTQLGPNPPRRRRGAVTTTTLLAFSVLFPDNPLFSYSHLYSVFSFHSSRCAGHPLCPVYTYPTCAACTTKTKTTRRVVTCCLLISPPRRRPTPPPPVPDERV
jgi:hypothetical protein